MISYSHDTFLVVASIVVSMVAAFTGLALTNNISHLSDSRRKALVVMSSFVLGTGIWSMHFVAMLAHQFPMPVYYDVLQTLSSALVAILVVGVSLLLLHFTVRTPRILVVAGLILGVGILSMHYLGMMGIRGVEPFFSVMVTCLSVVVAVVMGVAAIAVAYGRRSKQNIVAGSLLMGFSVVIVHFTAMHGTQFSRTTDFVPESAVLATSTLAVIVTVTAFVICGSFLLAATTFLTTSVPVNQPLHAQADSVQGTQKPAGQSPWQSKGQSTGQATSQLSLHGTQQRVQQGDQPGSQYSSESSSESIVRTSAEPAPQNSPLHSDESEAAQVPHMAVASAGNAEPPAQQPAAASHASVSSTSPEPVKIPFEKDKKIGFVMSNDIAAIRADGHYSHLYTSDGVRFCPWSITESEKRLADQGFHRTHRSYLVNIEAVARFEKRKETGICVFENTPQLSTVPVSRNRVIGLVEVLERSAS